MGFNSSKDELNKLDPKFNNLKKIQMYKQIQLFLYLDICSYIVISGILDEQAEEIIDFYQQNGLVVFDRIDIGEWVTLTVASGK